MKTLILGSNGFIGNALMTFLEENGHKVKGIDNDLRKKNVSSVSGSSLIKVKKHPKTEFLNILEYQKLKDFILDFNPDVVVHLAEQPSAPFSMIDANRAGNTQYNNIIGTLNILWAIKEVNPEISLIKLGTEGEYPDWLWDGKHIPEGNRIKVDWNGHKDWEIPTPRYGGSLYHLSKLYDSYNIDYACKIWGLKATDVNQGIVYGHRYDTRFDYDEFFGTVVNRFAVQAMVGIPLTVYGSGRQTRGFINLQNSIEAIKLLAENPPEKGEFRVIHQTTEARNVKSIADVIQDITGCEVQYLKNPRAEMNENSFTFETKTLDDLGLKKIPMTDEIPRLLNVVEKNKDKIIQNVIIPKTKWN